MLEALIFDMDGTMIDSMACHKQSWTAFARSKGLNIDVPDLMARTTGRTGVECMSELFGRPLPVEEARAYVREKEEAYRKLFEPIFAEVAGFKAFEESARNRRLKIGVGTAGDRDNVAFAYRNLRLPVAPMATVGGDEGLPGKPEPDIFLEVARRLGVQPQNCIVFEDAPLGIEAARRAGMRAVGLCTSHSAAELDGPHVLARVRDYNELMDLNFLEKYHAANS